MKAGAVLGVVLMILRVLAIAYQGTTFTTQKKVLDIGALHVTKEEHKTIPLPPILGGVALVAGVLLILSEGKNG